MNALFSPQFSYGPVIWIFGAIALSYPPPPPIVIDDSS